jgi:hypothetical protein
MLRVIVACWCLLVVVGCGARRIDPGGSSPKLLGQGQVPAGFPRKVVGRGLDQESAKEDAYLKAQKQIADWLRGLGPPLTNWQPSLEYIRQLPATGARGPEMALSDGTTSETWILTLSVPQPWEIEHWYKEAQDAENAVRARERIILLGKSLVGVVALLAIVAGYLRLDDWTLRRYSRWLQLGGATLVFFALVSWWILL